MADKEALVAVGALLVALKDSYLPVRYPSWANGTFYGKPLNVQRVRPVPAGADWTDIARVDGRLDNVGIVTTYSATSQGNISVAGLEFRVVKSGIVQSGIQIGAGVDLSKEGLTYPVTPRGVRMFVLENEWLAVQARNPTAFQRNAICSLCGFFYSTYDATQVGVDSGVTDAIYKPFLGMT